MVDYLFEFLSKSCPFFFSFFLYIFFQITCPVFAYTNNKTSILR